MNRYMVGVVGDYFAHSGGGLFILLMVSFAVQIGMS